MARDSDGVRTVSGYNPKEKTDAEKVESCTKEIQRLENLLDAQKRILASAEKRLEQAQKEV
jgi:predicted RNase H-like nuclease (RuvC/YqgF family)